MANEPKPSNEAAPKAISPRPSNVGQRPEPEAPAPKFDYDHWMARRDAEAEKYLLDHGWQRDLFNKWIDPNSIGGKAEERVMGQLPVKGGTTTPVIQLALPPSPWPWGLMDAVAMQQHRDREGKEKLEKVA